MADWDAIILGAGAAGLYAAGIAAARGLRVLVLDHAAAPGEKIRISGGGRCNFTNVNTRPAAFLSQNPHFCKSALARHRPEAFIALIRSYGIAFHEKELGQLFCDGSARQVVAMLLSEMKGAELRLSTTVEDIARDGAGFRLRLSGGGEERASNLVVATGGKSIPKMGATSFGYRVTAQFGLPVTETRPALVPLTFGPDQLAWMAPLSGVSLPVTVRATGPAAKGAAFTEALLFTHRGLSGPAILQISSYWREGEDIVLTLLPDALPFLKERRAAVPKRHLGAVLAERLPARLASALAERAGQPGPLGPMSDAALARIAESLAAFRMTPTASEGYRTAEVTLGGVATDGLDAGTMEARAVPGLHFIGEVVDVTGWLGGYNFQWAWSSAHACATALAPRD